MTPRGNERKRKMDSPAQKLTLGAKLRNLWHYFTLYEKIWFLSILVLAVAFAFIFPETDDPTYTLEFVSLKADENAVLDFEGIEDDFILDSLTLVHADGEEEELDIVKNGKVFTEEYTLTPDDEDSLIYELGAVREGDTLLLEFEPDGESTEFFVKLTAGGNVISKAADTEEAADTGDGDFYVNKLNYLVPVFVITLLYLIDVITNIACELLISKQSKWNFMISLAVEITEILICILCAYRFATLAVTILFWIPCDIMSFVIWNKHPDKQQKELTIVKKPKPWQDAVLVLGIAVWTVGVGYALTFIDVQGGVLANSNVFVKNLICYLDACASAVGIANGVFILLRYREQWIAWYIVAILETVINIMAGQWILLVLKAGYLTNTTYGYIKWTKYIKTHTQTIAEDRVRA